MACEGEWMGKRYLSESAWNAMHAEPVYRSMGMQGTFCQGGVAEFAIPKTGSSRLARSLNVGREGFMGGWALVDQSFNGTLKSVLVLVLSRLDCMSLI